MSEYRLRQGHHEPRNLWEHHKDEEPGSKSGQCVGRVDTPALAAEIVRAVNTARDGGRKRPTTASYNDCRLGPLRTLGEEEDG